VPVTAPTTKQPELNERVNVRVLILTDHFGGSGRAVGQVCVSVCLCVCVLTITFELIFQLDTWDAGSP